MTAGAIFLIIFSYILGSTPYGYLIAKFWHGIDIQEIGSKSIGATNVARATGIINGFITLLLDMLKGAIPVIMALYVFESDLVVVLALNAAIIGHIFPVFTKFKVGGKGVSTLLGGLLAGLMPIKIFLIIGIIWVIVLIASKRKMSLSNLVFITILLITLFFLHKSWQVLGFSIVTTGLIWWSHRENIKRLREGEESSLEVDTEKIKEFFRKIKIFLKKK